MLQHFDKLSTNLRLYNILFLFLRVKRTDTVRPEDSGTPCSRARGNKRSRIVDTIENEAGNVLQCQESRVHEQIPLCTFWINSTLKIWVRQWGRGSAQPCNE